MSSAHVASCMALRHDNVSYFYNILIMFYSSDTEVGLGEVSWLTYFILNFTYSQSTTVYTWDTLSCPHYYYDVMVNNNDCRIGM